MRWQVEFGDRVEFLEKVAKSSGKTPPALLSRPTPTAHAAAYLQAFMRLNGSRQLGAEGRHAPIPLTEILAYAQMFGYDTFQERRDLLRYISVCDKTYLEQIERKSGGGGPGKLPKNRRGFASGRAGR